MLNKGKVIVDSTGGAPVAISYGNQSPASDAVPLAWNAGDRRYPAGVTGTYYDAFWVCLAGGTPGTWVRITVPNPVSTFRHQYRYNGLNPTGAPDSLTDDSWPFTDAAWYLGFTGPDIRAPGSGDTLPTMNGSPVDLSGTEYIVVSMSFEKNSFTTPPTPGGLEFFVVNQTGAVVCTCDPINTGTLGYVQAYYGPPLVPINEGDYLSLLLHTTLAAGPGLLRVGVTVNGYIRTIH